MTSRGLGLALSLLALLAASSAAAQTQGRKRSPSRAELRQYLEELEAKLEALRAEKATAGAAAAEEQRLASLEKSLGELRARLEAPPAQDPRLEELAGSLEELRDEAASKDDLRKYVRKPDEKQFKSRTALELELRTAYLDLRQGELEARVASLGQLMAVPGITPRSRAILAAVGGLGAMLEQNDARLRPRLLFRLTWETNRFLDDDTFLFVSATPELGLFVYQPDVDRALMPRDAAEPRDRIGLIFKKATAGVTRGAMTLQAGVLQFTHGSGFFVNPTNPFTPKNPLDPRREVDGIPAARLDVALLRRETVTVTAQATAVAAPVRNDVVDQHGDSLGLGGLAMLRADTGPVSVSAVGIYEAPNDIGRNAASFGGTIVTNPFGLTASVEALFSGGNDGDDWKPDLVASLQGFTPSVGANGTTYILEYVYNGSLPATAADAGGELAQGVLGEQALLVLDRMTRPLGRRHYLNLYLEPSLTEKLRVNLAGLIGFDEAPGALLRAGLDWELYNFTVHAFGGALLGAEDSEFNHHLVGGFAELAVFANF
jgi:hypothetical protein